MVHVTKNKYPSGEKVNDNAYLENHISTEYNLCINDKLKNLFLFSVSRVWLQFPDEATAYQPHAGAHGGDAVLLPQVSAEVQAFSWQKQPQVRTGLNKMNFSSDLRYFS